MNTEPLIQTPLDPPWRTLYNLIKNNKIGTVFPWKWLESYLKLDRSSIREIIYRVNKELLHMDRKLLINLHNKGYKIASPPEQLSHAKDREERGIRQFHRGVSEALNIDFSQATPEEKVRAVHFANYLQEHLRKIEDQTVISLQQTKASVTAQENTVEEIGGILQELEGLKSRIKEISETK